MTHTLAHLQKSPLPRLYMYVVRVPEQYFTAWCIWEHVYCIYVGIVNSISKWTHKPNTRCSIKYLRMLCTLYTRSNRVYRYDIHETHPKCWWWCWNCDVAMAEGTMDTDVRGWINRGGVDLRSFSIRSKSVARELSSWKLKNEKHKLNITKKIECVCVCCRDEVGPDARLCIGMPLHWDNHDSWTLLQKMFTGAWVFLFIEVLRKDYGKEITKA